MTITIVADAGSASANSLGTLAEADAYFSTRLGGNLWLDYGAEDRKKALVTATQRVCAEVYRGQVVSTTQALAFPRINIYRAGFLLPTDAIPDFAKSATFEEALALLKLSGADADKDPFRKTGTEELKALRAGDIALDFIDRAENTDNASAADDPSRSLASPQAYRLLRPYLLTDSLRMTQGPRNFRIFRG